jgi:hypothetical protein
MIGAGLFVGIRKPVSSRSSIQLNFTDTRDAVFPERLRNPPRLSETKASGAHAAGKSKPAREYYKQEMKRNDR